MRTRRLETPYVAARLLVGLKGFYTLKELEELLGVPAQAIWRYTSFIQIPEKGTAQRILAAVAEKRLVEKALAGAITGGPGGLREPWRVLYDRHLLTLIGYKALKSEWGGEVDVVMASSAAEGALALSVSEWLRARTLVAMREPWLSAAQPLYAVYASADRRGYSVLYVPRGLLRKGDRVLLVKAAARDWASLGALLHLVEGSQARVCGALVVASLSPEWRGRAERYGVSPIEVVRSLEEEK